MNSIYHVRTGIVAIVLALSFVGTHLHAESQEPPTKAESRSGEQDGTPSVVIIQPQEETKPQPKKNELLTEEEAYNLVWNLPEVKKEIENILDQGGVPVATVGMRPSPGSQPGEGNSFYAIRFQGVRAKSVFIEMLFYVDAFTGQILVYDSPAGSPISLDDWHRQSK